MNEGIISQGRALSLDVGLRRIGLAVTDPLGLTAQGIETLQRKNKRSDLAALAAIVERWGVTEFVCGLPLRMSGVDSRQTAKVREFAGWLEKAFGLPVHLWDERLTSVEANRVLRSAELSIEKRAAAVDRLAAVLILQSWLEAHPRRAVSSEE